MKKWLCVLLCMTLLLCLVGCRSTDSETPQSIMDLCGLNVDIVPAGAQDITYRTLDLDTGKEPLLAAEAAFKLDGTLYRYRVASDTGTVTDEVYDLSQLEIPDAITESATVGWCNATLVYEPDGAGKIVWFDIAPGLIYSLDMDQGASAAALLSMAEQLYTPAQGDVG